jgi:formylglycine-generating enzyme required for sulfatase activity
VKVVRVDDDLIIELVRIPAGAFLLGDTIGHGGDDEWPASVVRFKRDFWMGRHEITNEQIRHFLPEHVSGFFTKRQIEFDGPGIQLDEPRQPAVRVSWAEAMLFCRRLSDATALTFTLPTEAQWEYAARAGSTTALSYGDLDADFSTWANVADRSLACLYVGTAGVANLQPFPSVMKFDDEALATTPVASYRPNAWGLFDMHGNAAEWTRSAYRPYPYDADDGRNEVDDVSEKRVVRGGSFCDRPSRCRSASRLAYPTWQGVHNVGFRVVVEADRD